MIKPALSAEEWEERRISPLTNAHVAEWCGNTCADNHKTAALCLDKQEFGFTHDMADALDTFGHYSQTDEEHELALLAIVNIRRLLAPEGTP